MESAPSMSITESRAVVDLSLFVRQTTLSSLTNSFAVKKQSVEDTESTTLTTIFGSTCTLSYLCVVRHPVELAERVRIENEYTDMAQASTYDNFQQVVAQLMNVQ